jgi:chromosome segregation and condensation protein ScpB
MVVDEPVTEVILAQITEVPTDLVIDALNALATSYERARSRFSTEGSCRGLAIL